MESERVDSAIKESLKTHEEYMKNNKLVDFVTCIHAVKNMNVSAFWEVIYANESIIFVHLNYEGPPLILYSVVLNKSLELKIYFKQTSILSDKKSIPKVVNYAYEISTVLDFVETSVRMNNISDNFSVIRDSLNILREADPENEHFYSFFSAQMDLICTKKNRLKYDSDVFLFSALFFLLSPQGYNYVRNSGNLILPHPSTIRRICNSFKVGPELEQKDEGFLFYIKQRVNGLEPNEKIVILMVDEIYLKQFIDYKGGNIVGTGHSSDQLASTAHVFMIHSLFSSYKDVVHILPVNSLTAVCLSSLIRKIIIGLEQIGLTIICVVSDNNAINRKAMSLFSNPPKLNIVYPHPLMSLVLYFLLLTLFIF